MKQRSICIGVMSGTSLDGADAVACLFENNQIRFLGHSNLAFEASLKKELECLLRPSENEIERMGSIGIELAQVYAQVVLKLVSALQLTSKDIDAIGVHGQTIRHCPQKHFTVQLNNPALVAELTGIDVIADFRSRDMAAGGEGAPLVPAFHHALFATNTPRAIVNIGGIANVSFLTNDAVTGFDCGPGNTLLDTWCMKHQGQPFDSDGKWAKTGRINASLLEALYSDPYFKRQPPKSTGREYFHLDWVKKRFPALDKLPKEDVQRTLVKLTAMGISEAIAQSPSNIKDLFICGGGAFNPLILRDLEDGGFVVNSTEVLGVHPMHVESMAFAWLAHRFLLRQSGNHPAVTHAKGPRILGALYPAY